MLNEFLKVGAEMDFSPLMSGNAYGGKPGGAEVRMLYATWPGDGCEFGLRLTRSAFAVTERWTVRCAEVHDYRLVGAPYSELRLADEHVLLDRYYAPPARLGFRGRPSSVGDAIVALAEAHRQYAADWIPFDTYLNPQVELAELLAAGSGILADGPRPLLEAYAIALRRHEIDLSVLPADSAMRHPPPQPRLQALLLTPSYVVGAHFEAQRHPDDSAASVA